MKIESITIKNFKNFQNAEATNLPDLAVFIGKNGSGKTSFFDIFGFLHDCLIGNVKSALAKRGGYREVISRDTMEKIFVLLSNLDNLQVIL